MNLIRSFYKNENLYLAGPQCFYPDAAKQLLAMRYMAEALGFGVSLPNDNPLELKHEDLRKNADSIFHNCAVSMNAATAILVDLVNFRGAEPDGGSIYEMGMAYARGLRCYAYSHNMRPTACKYQGASLRDGKVYDLDGRILPYQDLPYSPCIVGSSKLVEGDLGDCLRALMQDLEQERKHKARRQEPARNLSSGITIEKSGKPVIYIAGQDRYDNSTKPRWEQRKELCRRYGFEPVCPIDDAPEVAQVATDDPLTAAYNLFDRWQQHVRNCDIIVADLNDFHGWEPNSDISFEAGMAWQLGKKCFGYMEDTSHMRVRIPHYGEDKEFRDLCGNDVENFNYPINLMFSSSMPVLQGDFEAVIAQIGAEQ